MTSDTLLELADRVEGASGLDRELDQAVHAIVSSDRAHPYLPGTQIDDSHPSGRPYPTPAYTASIDAALTLVPERWEWAYLDMRAIVRKPQSFDHAFGEASTPALALTAAALRARAHG